MKKLFLLLAVVGLMFSACTEGGGIEDDNGTTEQPGGGGNNSDDDGGDSEKPEDIFFALDKEEITIKPDGGSAEVVVYSNYKWAISGTSDWCTPSVKEGNANEDGQKVTFSADMTYDSREAVFWFRCADKAIKLVVKQSLKEVIIADDNNTFDVSAEGGTVEIAYQTSVECEVIIPDEAKEWISIAPKTKGLVSEKANLTVAENKTYEARSAVIKVVKRGDGTLCTEYSVNQKQNDAIIADGNNAFEIPIVGSNVEIAYQTNVECEVIIPNEAKEWISIAPKTKGLVSEKTTLIVAANITEEARSAVVKVVAAGNEELMTEYTINQAHGYILKYTSSNGNIVTPDNNNAFGARILGNEYKDVIGYLVCDAPITSIGEKAFSGCSSLTSVTIPDSVTKIGERAFNGCSSLTSFYGKFASSDSRCLIVDGVLNSFAPANLTSYTIPDSVTEIGNYAFQYCSSLTSITIPDSVTSIGEGAFYGCTGELIINSKIVENDYNGYDYPSDDVWLKGAKFTKLTIGDSVTSIGNYAFQGCSSLTSITIPDSVAEIGESAFYGCTGELIINSNCLGLFSGKFTKLTIGDSVTSIGEEAFYSCRSLTSVTIGDSVTSIGDGAFWNCSSLTSITIPDSVTEIGGRAFINCSSLTSITIPDSVTKIGWSAFSTCSSLKEVYCKATTPPAGFDYMFSGNASGRKIYVPRNSVDSYKSASFWRGYAADIVGYDF